MWFHLVFFGYHLLVLLDINILLLVGFFVIHGSCLMICFIEKIEINKRNCQKVLVPWFVIQFISTHNIDIISSLARTVVAFGNSSAERSQWVTIIVTVCMAVVCFRECTSYADQLSHELSHSLLIQMF